MPEEIQYRCPECDTYSGIFTPSTDTDGEDVLIHNICGLEAVVAAFIPGTPENTAIYEGWSDEEDEDDEEIDFSDLEPVAMNANRTQTAGIAVTAFTLATHMQDEEPESILGDLLANLHHWADAHDLDWDVISDRADRNHDIEVDEARDDA